MMKRIGILVVTILTVFSVSAQKKGHKISLTAPQLANETFYLAYHYEQKQYISDTLIFDNKGKLTIEGDEPLHHGVYLAVFPSLKNRYYEFLIKDQFFSMELKDTTKMNEVSFVNSQDNLIFQTDMNEMQELRNASQVLDGKIKTATSEEEKQKWKEELNDINTAFTEKRVKLMEDNPDLFYSDILGMLREIKIPESPKDGNGEELIENFRFKYFRSHYWDYVDFSEEGIIRTPLFKTKIDDFLEKYTYKSQDSLIHSCDIIVELAKANEKVFQYVLVTLVNKYANSKVMGDDAVYVHLVKNYYETGLASWINEEQLAKMKERRVALEPLLIGKISPNLTLRDTTISNLYTLHDITTDYTILYIWDPECGHCKKVTPKLGEFYKKHTNESLSVYAITTSNIEEIDVWKNFIKKHNLDWINVGDLYHQTNFRSLYDVTSTPQVFVLDKNKKIIAKRIGVEQLEGFFHQYMKNTGDENYINFELDTNALNGEDEHHEGDGHAH
jgi:thiol-disulfide isomerase/thioredoxin